MKRDDLKAVAFIVVIGAVFALVLYALQLANDASGHNH